jgi:spore germination cell wall hydrolase CwlJ-like protein
MAVFVSPTDFSQRPGILTALPVAVIAMDEAPHSAAGVGSLSLGDVGGQAAVAVGASGVVVIEGSGPIEIDSIVTGTITTADPASAEEQVDRSWKGDRYTPMPPIPGPAFAPASLIDDQTHLTPPDPGADPFAIFAAANTSGAARFVRPAPTALQMAAMAPAPLPPRRPAVPAALPSVPTVMNAYASMGAEPAAQGMFDALFAVPKSRPDAPGVTVGPGDHWWKALALPATVYTASEQRCLAEAVYFEARGEGRKGQTAVAQVVLNRVKNPAYPSTICGVVYQNQSMRNACQFSFACDGIKDVVRPGRAWHRAELVARDTTFGGVWLENVGTATHYHATSVRPNWAAVFTKKAKIGRHVFYQTIYGGWS